MIADIILKVAAMQGEEEGNHAYYPRPSLAGPERCIRQMVFWGMGIERQALPGRAVMIFDDSSFHEDLTGDWIRKSAFQLHSEQMKVDVGEKYGIYLQGSIDGIITDLTGQDIISPFRSIGRARSRWTISRRHASTIWGSRKTTRTSGQVFSSSKIKTPLNTWNTLLTIMGIPTTPLSGNEPIHRVKR